VDISIITEELGFALQYSLLFCSASVVRYLGYKGGMHVKTALLHTRQIFTKNSEKSCRKKLGFFIDLFANNLVLIIGLILPFCRKKEIKLDSI